MLWWGQGDTCLVFCCSIVHLGTTLHACACEHCIHHGTHVIMIVLTVKHTIITLDFVRLYYGALLTYNNIVHAQ